MQKDKGNKESSGKEPLEPGALVERRAKKGDPAPREPQAALRRPLSAEAFQEQLLRYCRRSQKDGREFCVASLTVLEYRRASDAQKEQLDKVVVSVLLKCLRAEDRICFIEPAHYLILTPYTSLDDSNKAMSRVAEKISNTRIRVKADFIQPSAFFKVVSSASRTSYDKGETVIDCESIYNSIGYTLDSKGRLRCLEEPDDRNDEPLFRGNLESWMERYAVEKTSKKKTAAKTGASKNGSDTSPSGNGNGHMLDRWNNNAAVMFREISVLDQPDATISSAFSVNLLRRLRVLQNLDHPGLNKLTDFYAKRDGRLLLVNYLPSGVELTAPDFDAKCSLSIELSSSVLLTWLQQILNAFIAMQALVPPVVPSSFENIRVFHTESDCKEGCRLVLCNYEIEYLTASGTSTDIAESRVNVNGQHGLLAGLAEFIVQLSASSRKGKDKNLIAFLKELDAATLSTPYKMRTQVKNFAESLHA